ncbi:uncharacterized protein PODANS_3_5590, partial [Podospora anserina S mat+]
STDSSCITCRKRKIRCDRKAPCGNCLKSKGSSCSYRDPPLSPPKATTPRCATSLPNDCVDDENDELDVASCFSITTPPMPPSLHTRPATSAKATGSTALPWFETYLRSLSHTSATILLPIVGCMLECKGLAKTLKSRVLSCWPYEPLFDVPPDHDDLLRNYISTSESIFRVMHIPSFTRDFHALCTSPTPPTNAAFIVQAKLVCAIGATHTDTVLRQEATQWVQDAQTWLSKPDFKHQLSLQHLQSHILLLLARKAVGVAEDMIWISVGSLLRTAMYMGLHRDGVIGTSPNTNLFTSEMRRRIWNTILELSVQSSLNSGGLSHGKSHPPVTTTNNTVDTTARRGNCKL